MRVIIAGCRTFTPEQERHEALFAQLDEIIKKYNTKSEKIRIISGHASGADHLGELYANSRNYVLNLFPADWAQFGRSAGPRRNEQMAQYASALPDTVQSLLIAYWDGKSAGTKSMIDLARRHNIPIHIIHI